MSIDDKTTSKVCDINAILNVRLIFGYYSDINKTSKTRLLWKLYCAVFAAIIIYMFGTHSTYLLAIYFVSACIEYGIAFLISIWTEDKYILKYYECTILDNLPNAKETYGKLERILKICLFMIVVFRTANLLGFCTTNYQACLDKPSVVVLFNVMWFARDIGRYPVVMIFSLLFCRLRLLRETLLTKGFDNSPKNRLTPRRYIQMYEMLMDALSATDFPLKLVIINNMCCCIPPTLLDLYISIDEFKENGPTSNGVFWIMLRVTEPIAILIVAVVLLDLMSEDMVAMLCFTQEKCMQSATERDRSEIQKLLMVLRDRPLRYSVYRVVNLSMREMACFYSFSITTIIAILQIKNF